MFFRRDLDGNELKKLPQGSFSKLVSLQTLWVNDAFLCLLFPITYQKGPKDLSWLGNAESQKLINSPYLSNFHCFRFSLTHFGDISWQCFSAVWTEVIIISKITLSIFRYIMKKNKTCSSSRMRVMSISKTVFDWSYN